jgi:leader peptidase (prepilin peptidase)/N-methyltransferase
MHAVVSQALSVQPDNAQLIELLIEAQQGCGQYEDALVTAERLIALKPHAYDGYWRASSICADVALESNSENVRHAWWQESARYARAAIEAAPENPLTYSRLAAALNSLPGFEAEARQIVAREIELAPDSPGPYADAGDVAMASEEWSEAERWYERALALDPTDTYAQLSLAEARAEAGSPKRARPIIESVLRIDPRHEWAKALLDRVTARSTTPPRALVRVILPNRRGALVTILAVATGVGASLIRFGPSARGLAGAVFLGLVALLAVVNSRTRTYPNVILISAYPLVLLAGLPRGNHLTGTHLAAGFAFFIALFVVALATPTLIGMGDVKLAMLIGLGLGRATTTAAVVAVIAAVPLFHLPRLRPQIFRSPGVPSWPMWIAATAAAFFTGNW